MYDIAVAGLIGVDIVQISRIREIANRRGERFYQRFFSRHELSYSFSRSQPFVHLAARFAAKEAAIKALSAAGLRGALASQIEVVNDAGGVPRLRLSRQLRQRLSASATGVGEMLVSLSHDGDYAIAAVLGV